MESDKILDKISEAIEEAIRPILKKGESMSTADLEVLNKAVCVIEKIKIIQAVGYYHDTAVDSSRRYYDAINLHNGYSGHSFEDKMIARLEEMYNEAQNDHERQIVRNLINRARY